MTKFLVDTGETLPNNLVAYWKMNEASRSRYDEINPGSGPAGQFVKANVEYLSVTDTASLSMGDIDFTIAAWVLFDTTTGEPWILHKGVDQNLTNATTEYGVFWSGTDFQFIVGNGTTSGSVSSTAQPSVTTGVWYFVVCWHDATANTLNIQIDNGTVNTNSYANGSYDSTSEFRLGGRNPTINQRTWDGRISLVGIWKKALTSAERTSIYNSGKGKDYRRLSGSEKTSLQAYWNLHEGSGTRFDFHGTNNLTDNNTVTQASGVEIGNTLGDNNTVTFSAGKTDVTQAAGQFTFANSEYLSTPDNTLLSTGDIDFTLACWVYMDSNTGDAMNVITKFNASIDNREYALDYGGTANRFSFTVNHLGTAGNNAVVVANSFGTLSTGTWAFIVCWHDSVNNTINIQVNNGTVDSTSTSNGVLDGTSAFRIGSNGNNTPGQFWNGRIDEVGFWKKVLTTQERTDLYNSGTGNTIVADGNTPGVDEALIAADVTGEFLQLFPI